MAEPQLTQFEHILIGLVCLAVDHGLTIHHASLRWTRHAIAALRAAPAPSSQPSSS